MRFNKFGSTLEYIILIKGTIYNLLMLHLQIALCKVQLLNLLVIKSHKGNNFWNFKYTKNQVINVIICHRNQCVPLKKHVLIKYSRWEVILFLKIRELGLHEVIFKIKSFPIQNSSFKIKYYNGVMNIYRQGNYHHPDNVKFHIILCLSHSRIIVIWGFNIFTETHIYICNDRSP